MHAWTSPHDSSSSTSTFSIKNSFRTHRHGSVELRPLNAPTWLAWGIRRYESGTISCIHVALQLRVPRTHLVDLQRSVSPLGIMPLASMLQNHLQVYQCRRLDHFLGPSTRDEASTSHSGCIANYHPQSIRAGSGLGFSALKRTRSSPPRPRSDSPMALLLPANQWTAAEIVPHGPCRSTSKYERPY